MKGDLLRNRKNNLITLCSCMSSLAAISLIPIGLFDINLFGYFFGEHPSILSHTFFALLAIASVSSIIPSLILGLFQLIVGVIPSILSVIGSLYVAFDGLFNYERFIGPHTHHFLFFVLGLSGLWTFIVEMMTFLARNRSGPR